jgi:hypothetical protein
MVGQQEPTFAGDNSVIDLSNEDTFSLALAAQTIRPGRNGKRTHISTLIRWITRGARAADGSRVRLEAVRLGGRWLTSREALQRFAERLTPRLDDQHHAPPSGARTPSARQRASERAARKLKEMGV